MPEKRENSGEIPEEQPIQTGPVDEVDLNPQSDTAELKIEKENSPVEFTPEQLTEIENKRQILSSLAYFIGKDFNIPVELNQPGAGWHWDFKENKIRVDPKDLLEKPMDYLRFVISHEGGHRRISRAEFIPLEEWQQPGFSAMMNAIEDPRDNNFVAESYPKFKEQMKSAYDLLETEQKLKEEAGEKLGQMPRFAQAGLEYIKQWYRESQGEEFELSARLPEDVKKVVQATIESARDSWWRYPSRREADNGGKIEGKKVDGEAMIRNYAKVSYEINRDEIWPEFKKLVEQDLEDQKMQEALQDIAKSAKKEPNDGQSQQGQGGGKDQKGEEGPEPSAESGSGEAKEGQSSRGGLPKNLKDKLTPEEQKSLQDAIEKSIEESEKKEEGTAEGSEGQKKGDAGSDKENKSQKPVNLDELSEELKQKIREYIDSLPDDQREELAKRAAEKLKEFEDSINEELEGKLSDDPEKKAERQEAGEEESGRAQISAGETVRTGSFPKQPVDIQGILKYKERLSREIHKDANVYEQHRNEVLPLIDKLETELRQIFTDRKTTAWKGGHKTGKRIDIKTRIQEKAKDVSAVESRAWQKRELPKEKDYAISLLVDLSGSMRTGGKIQETFKSVIVLAEVLNKLGIEVEILGFNDDMYEYQAFGQDMSKPIREHMGGMFQEVEDSCCKSCGKEHNETDLGWAMEQATERLAKQKQENKFIITISDGVLQASDKHPGSQNNLSETLKKAAENNIGAIGLEVGKGGEIGNFYPNNITGINAQDLPPKLAELLKDVIANSGKF